MKYDLVIIGGGWAGYNAALQAVKLGKSACLIERDKIGGTCLNKGCIPTKILTNFAKKSKNEDYSLLCLQQIELINKLKMGMESTLKAKKIDWVKGAAKIVADKKIIVQEISAASSSGGIKTASSKFPAVDMDQNLNSPKSLEGIPFLDSSKRQENNQEIEADFILIATGAVPRDLPFLKFDHKKVLSSDDILCNEQFVGDLLIIGGGVIGCEFASALNALGVNITIIELTDRLLPMFDRDVSSKIEQSFKQAGIKIKTSCDLQKEDLSSYEKILLCVGRKIDLGGLISPEVNIEIEKTGVIKTNKYLMTSIPNIYAAGDCVGGFQLAHVAEFEARKAVCNMFFGDKQELDYSVVPSSVFTYPEAAQVGVGEEQAKKEFRNVRIIKKHFLSIGMAHILKETQGFLKLIIDEKGVIIGASIMGCYATELVNTLGMAVKTKLTLKDLENVIFAHPSISEIISEAVKS